MKVLWDVWIWWGFATIFFKLFFIRLWCNFDSWLGNIEGIPTPFWILTISPYFTFQKFKPMGKRF